MNKNSIIITSILVLLVVVIGTAVGISMNNNTNNNTNNSSNVSEKYPVVGGATMYPDKNIVENVSKADNLKTLVTAVTAADLVDTLQSDGPFTVFAPLDSAFEALPSGTVETLLKPENKATLQSILTYHVVPGNIKAADLEQGQELTTVQGRSLKVGKTDDKFTIDGAFIETADVLQSNGVVHVINKVLLPNENPAVGGIIMSRNNNIVQNASTVPTLNTVVAAIKAASLAEALQGAGPFTVFAPDNNAFTKLPAGTLDSLLKPENKATLQSILTYHAVSGNYLSKNLTDGQVLNTLNGQKLTVVKADGKVSLKSETAGNVAVVTIADIEQSNGVVHIIDSVLLPKN